MVNGVFILMLLLPVLIKSVLLIDNDKTLFSLGTDISTGVSEARSPVASMILIVMELKVRDKKSSFSLSGNDKENV